jgi:glucokinase-like ROK family protein
MRYLRVQGNHRPPTEYDEEALILSLVRRQGTCSRVDLAIQTGLSKSVLGARLRPLLRQGLIIEEGLGASTGGRPPTLIRFGKRAGFVIAVDLEAEQVQVAVANLNAEPEVCLTEAIGVHTGRESVLDAVHALIERALDKSGVSRDLVRGIGVGVGGPVEFRTGRLRTVSPQGAPFPIREYFEDAYPWPVLIDNDANLLALAEQWAGGARDVDDFLFVKLGTGIGCGIVCGGRIYRGADGWAGELGHMQVPGLDRPCPCGSTGCLGRIAGAHGLAQTAEELARSKRSPYLARLWDEGGRLSVEDLWAAMREGDAVAVEAIRQAGSSVGRVLGGVVTFCNPSLIVVGGEVARLGDFMLSTIRESVYRWALPQSARHLTVTGSQLGDESPLVGAAAMAVCEVYRMQPCPPQAAGIPVDSGR